MEFFEIFEDAHFDQSQIKIDFTAALDQVGHFSILNNR